MGSEQVHDKLPLVQVTFRTEDAAIEKMHQYMYAHIRALGEDNVPLLRTTCLAPHRLFPVPHTEEGQCNDKCELNRLYEFLALKK